MTKTGIRPHFWAHCTSYLCSLAVSLQTSKAFKNRDYSFKWSWFIYLVLLFFSCLWTSKASKNQDYSLKWSWFIYLILLLFFPHISSLVFELFLVLKFLWWFFWRIFYKFIVKFFMIFLRIFWRFLLIFDKFFDEYFWKIFIYL